MKTKVTESNLNFLQGFWNNLKMCMKKQRTIIEHPSWMVQKWVRPEGHWSFRLAGGSAVVITVIHDLTFLQFQKNSFIWFLEAVTGIMDSQ